MPTALWNNAFHNNWVLVERILSRMPDADINAAPTEGAHAGKSVLWLTVYYQQWELVNKILEEHPEANPNASPQEGKEKDITVLGLTALFKKWKIFEKLLNQHLEASTFERLLGQHPEANIIVKKLMLRRPASIFDLIYLYKPELIIKIIARCPEIKIKIHTLLALPAKDSESILIDAKYLLELVHGQSVELKGIITPNNYFLIEALSYNHVIKTLKILITSFDKNLRNKLLNVIRNKPTLQEITMDRVNWGGKFGMEPLVNCLTKCTNIKFFNLQRTVSSKKREGFPQERPDLEISKQYLRLQQLPHLTTFILDDMVYEKDPIKATNLERIKHVSNEVPTLFNIGMFAVKKHLDFNIREIKKLENLIPKEVYDKVIDSLTHFTPIGKISR